jgi:AcrR family transcriptional regulator
MTHKAAEVLGPSQWTPRERELLAVTMRLLQKHGYCGLTLDAVAATARASKTTVYRRWPSKAELVLAALIEGVRQIAAVPETGSLRGDLLKLGEIICQQASTHATTMRAVLVEVSRNPALNDVMQQQLFEQKRKLVDHVLNQAVQRGDIEAATITDDLWDLIPGILSITHHQFFESSVGPATPIASWWRLPSAATKA